MDFVICETFAFLGLPLRVNASHVHVVVDATKERRAIPKQWLWNLMVLVCWCRIGFL